MKPYTLEICVDSTESALAAAQGGGTRLELCSNLVIGGTTPSLALFHEVQDHTGLDINVLLRPRFGDFLYTKHELSILCREAETFARAGAHGIVIGCLHRDGTLDMDAMRALIQAAEGCSVTLHRAFDVCRDPFRAMDQAAELGVDTILTSGQEADCWAGRKLLAQLIEKAPTGIEILIGAGVTPKTIAQLLQQMPARHFHMSGKKVLDSEMTYRNPKVSMGLPGISEFQLYQTDPEAVAQAARLLEQAWGTGTR